MHKGELSTEKLCFSSSLCVKPDKVVFISIALLCFSEVTVETALKVHKRHLLSDSGITFSFSLSAVCVQTNAKMGPNFCSKS